MKNNKLLLIPMLIWGGFQAQIGINHSNPKSTLDIVGGTNVNNPDGILIPRYTAPDLGKKDNAYGADQNGTLIFVTEGIGNSLKTINVKATGFYYYDAPNSIWKPIKGESNGGSILPGETIYYTEIFHLNGSSNQDLSNQPLVKPLPILDGLMIDINSYTGTYAYHPKFYNTTANSITISYTMGYNNASYSHGYLSIPASGQWFPFGNSSSPNSSTGTMPSWGSTYATNAMVTLMIKEKAYRIEWFCYDIQGVPSNTQRKVNIFITRLG
ncbi:hypothetical protein JET18_19040 [Chryseobacterium sp. L7]|uniref:Cleaved adhesin domain-containing protein n=1 Tax=Chryseobacterium endalhagicum TaxID=2797638 RepID=A0ABS1QL20_9FLAO|nr:hypothetical protein [Chryseobacterium endalhagicum]MBL1222957.1 hypothetical protein [Chryseobacterium endalhagicum]